MSSFKSSLVKLIMLLASLACSLDHEKSFLLQDGDSDVNSIAFYEGAMLLTSSNDIIQRDMVTGATQRTFRAHTKVIYSFIVHDNSTMITSGWDDMIVVWDLRSGSILRRIWLGATNTIVNSVSAWNNFGYCGGNDRKLRKIDLSNGRIVRTADLGSDILRVAAEDDFIFVGKLGTSSQLLKLDSSSLATVSFFIGHTDSVLTMMLSGSNLFSGSADLTVICWNSVTGEQIRSFSGNTSPIFALATFHDELYSGNFEGELLRWSVSTGALLLKFPNSHEGRLITMGVYENSLFTGSDDTRVIRWNVTAGEISQIYKSPGKKVWDMILWNNFVVSGSADAKIILWDASVNRLEPFSILLEHRRDILCLKVKANYLFSGSADYTIIQWNLTDSIKLRALSGHAGAVSSLDANNEFLFSGSGDNSVKQWKIQSGDLLANFLEHSNRITGIILSGEKLVSGSWDSTVVIRSIGSQQVIQARTFPALVNAISLTGNDLIAATGVGLYMFSLSSGQVLAAYPETVLASSLVSSEYRIYSGFVDGLIKGRELTTLVPIETYQGHSDVVNSLALDSAGTLFSAGFDGSVKRWNMVSRRVAFSFENRSSSVSTLAASGSFLFVGLNRGSVNLFDIRNVSFLQEFELHLKQVTSSVIESGILFTSGLDGSLISTSIEAKIDPVILFKSSTQPVKSLVVAKSHVFGVFGDLEIISLHLNHSAVRTISFNNSIPITYISASENVILAGTITGIIMAMETDSLQLSFTLNGHTSQVNHMVIDSGFLFSASNDKSIIQWSLKTEGVVQVLKRYSATALGHLGPVNSLSVCNGVLFSGGSDTTTRRWNIASGKHEDVYFGATKSVSSVLCHNFSVFSGSEDSCVLMFRPVLLEKPNTIFNSRASTLSRKPITIRDAKFANSSTSGTMLTQRMIIIVISVTILLFVTALFAFYFQRMTKFRLDSKKSKSAEETTSTAFTNLETVVNSIIGISKHAAFLVDGSSVGQIRKLTSGGGGEIFLVKAMTSFLGCKVGDTLIQKIVFVKSILNQEAFYQEVGIMIMLKPFRHICPIIGYTESPLSMILRYFPDGSLHDWLRKNTTNNRLRINILKDISDALNTMHSHFLAHCDLKPQNLLVEVNAGVLNCFLTDFGITQILSDEIVASRTFKIMNLRGMSCQYAAPEAFQYFRSKEYRSADFKKFDIYSFSCVICEVLTGRFPWY